MTKKILKNCPEYLRKICYSFAKECVKTNMDEYKKRDQNNTDKVIKDIYLGKIAEFLVFEFLTDKGKKVTPPDLLIYESNKKSFDSDLVIINDTNINVHVKSHDLTSEFPISWLFENYDELVKKPTDNDYIAFCCLSNDDNYMYLVKANSVKGIYKEPVKKNLKKSVIYEQDLLNLEI